MKKQLTYVTFGLLLTGLPFIEAAQAREFPMVLDSIGMERVNNRLFVVYRVSSGQTLFSIARRYNSSVEAIKEANPEMTGAVRTDQLIRVPFDNSALSRRETKAIEKAIRQEDKIKEKEARQEAQPETIGKSEKEETPKNGGIHVVEYGQTLYSLASQYNVPMTDIRRWNKLTSDQLSAGQTLVVTEWAYKNHVSTAPTPKHEPEKVAALPAKPEPDAPEPAKVGVSKTESGSPAASKAESTRVERIVISPAEANRPVPENRPIRPGDSTPLPTIGRRVSEIGLAEIIDDNDGTNKYLALHRSAPVGSLVQVRNDVNNQVVWVKIIGKLPDTGVNDRILIKLSTLAFEKLSPHDRRFRAEVSYLAQ